MRQLSPIARRVWRLSALVFWAMVLIAGVIVAVLVDGAGPWPWVGPLVLGALCVGVVPELRWRRWRWDLTEEGIDIQNGAISRQPDADPVGARAARGDAARRLRADLRAGDGDRPQRRLARTRSRCSRRPTPRSCASGSPRGREDRPRRLRTSPGESSATRGPGRASPAAPGGHGRVLRGGAAQRRLPAADHRRHAAAGRRTSTPAGCCGRPRYGVDRARGRGHQRLRPLEHDDVVDRRDRGPPPHRAAAQERHEGAARADRRRSTCTRARCSARSACSRSTCRPARARRAARSRCPRSPRPRSRSCARRAGPAARSPSTPSRRRAIRDACRGASWRSRRSPPASSACCCRSLAALGQVVAQVGEKEQEDAFRFLPHSVTVAVLVVVGLLAGRLAALDPRVGDRVRRLHDRARGGAHPAIRRGLIARNEATVPVGRVRAVRVVEGLLRRPFGLCALTVEVTGYAERGRARRGRCSRWCG